MAELFTQLSGMDGRPIAAFSALAMINGILVQLVMASRVLYGMSTEGLLPSWFAIVHPRRKTPMRATVVVAAAVILLALFFPLVRLAEATSVVTLSVFAAVNLSLYTIGRHSEDALIRRFHLWGIPAAGICGLLVVWQLLPAG
jgi:amino acid transporter